jgi:hypothetical protein
VATLAEMLMTCLIWGMASFSPWPHLFYLVTLTVPSLVFMLGLSLLVATFARRAIGSLLLLGYLFATLFFIGNAARGLFDAPGITLPSAFSDITGHPDTGRYLLQRASWLLVGLGFIGLTVARFRRLPNAPSRWRQALPGMALVAGGVLAGLFFFFQDLRDADARQLYADTYNKYAAAPKMTLLDQQIDYRQRGNRMFVTAHLVLENRTGKDAREVILYLNPGLRVTAARRDGSALAHARDRQVVTLSTGLPDGERLNVEISYEGRVDERVCYLDVPDVRPGQRFAILSRAYTWLTPECLWYPVAVPPANPAEPYNLVTDLSTYTLRVARDGRTILSQGTREEGEDAVTFRSDRPAPGIALCAGTYERRAITVDSVLMEVYHFKGHGKPIDYFEPLAESFPRNLASTMRFMEHTAKMSYPYPRLSLVEVPVHIIGHYRETHGSSELTQPGMIFFPERGAGIWLDHSRLKFIGDEEQRENRMTGMLHYSLRSAFMNEEVLPTAVRSNMSVPVHLPSLTNSPFRLLTGIPNPHNLMAIFFPGGMTPRYPGIPVLDAVLNRSLKARIPSEVPAIEDGGKSIDYLSGHSLREALVDATLPPDIVREIFRLKTVDLQDLFEARGVTRDSLLDFVTRHATPGISFDDFNRAFVEQHGVDWNEVLPRWYEGTVLPAYLVNNFTLEKLEWPDGLAIPTRVSCDVFNDSDVEGHVTFTTAFQDRGKDTRHYTMPPRAGKRIVFTLVDSPYEVMLNAHLSRNEPATIAGQWRSIASRDRDTARSVTPLAREQFFAPGEVIADNEDETFITTRPGGRSEWLRRWIQKREREKIMHYKATSLWDLQWNLHRTGSWVTYLDVNAYGLYVRSLFGKRAGNGKMSASWRARVERAGLYDVYVMIPYVFFVDNTGPNVFSTRIGGPVPDNESKLELFQHYTLTTAAGPSEVTVDISRRDLGWSLVGRFYLDAGEQCLTLDDRGESGQIIIGDAVKWVYAGDDEQGR